MPIETYEQPEAALTIQEMAKRSGFSEHTLRYYERIGLLTQIPRDDSSGHRRYSPDTIGLIETLVCLRGTGMSISDTRRYLRLRERGAEAAGEQKALFAAHETALAQAMELMSRQRQYLAGKVAYWEAVEAGDTAGAYAISEANRLLAETLASTKEKR